MLVTATRGHHFVLMSGGVRTGAIVSFQLEAQQLCTGGHLYQLVQLALSPPTACGVACLTRMLTDCLAVTHRADPHVPEQGAAAYSCTVHAGTHNSVLVQQPEATGAVSLLGQRLGIWRCPSLCLVVCSGTDSVCSCLKRMISHAQAKHTGCIMADRV